MNKTSRVIKKVIVSAVGFPLLIIGVILIPLPGPGLLICLVALIVLSLGFDWVKPYLEKIKKKLAKIVEQSKQSKK